MKKYKLIVSDYDGTLAGRDFIIPEKTKKAIKKWIETGHLFTIASGRQYLMLKRDVKELGIKTPLVVRGGAEVVNAEDGSVVIKEHISAETVDKLLKILLKHTNNVAVEKDDTIYSTFKFFGDFPEIKRKTLEEFKIDAAPKVMAKADLEHIAKLEEAMEEVRKEFSDINLVRSYTPLGSGWDITSIKGTKHLAILELLKLLKLDPSEVVGVGDGYNDFSLLEATGYKVAMEDAPEDLRAVADLIVPSYKESGVAVLIEKLLDEEKSS